MSTAPGHGPPPAPVRVLVLDHTAAPGGAELALVRLCAALGPDVSVRAVLFADGPLRPALLAVGVPVDVLELDPEVATVGRRDVLRGGLGGLRRVRGTVSFLVRLVRLLRRLRPDVVHTTSLKADLLGTLAATLAGRPVVWYVHDRIAPDYLPRPLVSLVRVAAYLPRAVIANSRATARTLPRHATIAYPGFSADQMSPDAPHDGPHDTPRDAPVVGIVGRVSPTKGQLELVRALPAVLARYPRATVRVVGGALFGAGDHAREVRTEAERLGVDAHVEWAGHVESPAEELDRFDVCVHASPVPEPFGQVVVEAMVRGVPVVATRAGGVPEILSHPDGDLGVLVETGDVDALAAGVLAVLDDPVAARERARRAREVAVERFAVGRTAAVVTAVWGRAAAGRR
ncbi:glycosyltransferase [Isoptericola sp. S6320L]|uniref:glycosyltransferase n=1 Tax=Isoptericola sp. S6320L TaxID=2926411 RepID=UPI001FF475C5|nr:glycosyltransferase [Isoptericola sp. S6320L]MCK0118391.1 glycosyltransferase [Isoptericola sp. S6320L]